ncbi:hypothetical protein, partial [Lacihabitans sp. CS3-21]|uniref:hypothetical protein n=1 Tax=Lacihabitans sp. CS3-21 TaxID=2487332 RepID=UPI0020CC8F05
MVFVVLGKRKYLESEFQTKKSSLIRLTKYGEWGGIPTNRATRGLFLLAVLKKSIKKASLKKDSLY